MTKFIQMECMASGHVVITVDISAYIHAFEEAYLTDLPVENNQHAIEAFKKLSNTIESELTGIPGQLRWIEALELATQHLTPEQQDTIEKSPAADMMNVSFIEIIKNSIDECIARYYDSNGSASLCMPLSLVIDNTSIPDQVSIQITDTGRGFSPHFLDNISTQAMRDAYVNTSGGSDKVNHRDRAPLFGGQGRGLRILIADEAGDVLERTGERIHRFTKPKVSSVELDNATDDDGQVLGARITVTTSLEPRTRVEHKQDQQDNVHRCTTPTLNLMFFTSEASHRQERQEHQEHKDELSPQV
ncbi:MAG: hypothetical protein P1U39_07640 [Legionellaceae bacterium]|nr:hypothetical protein [Legionellaceae bacterium]